MTTSAPAASRSAGVGSCPRPNAVVSSRAPDPRSSRTSAPCRWAIAATSVRSADSVKPLMAKLDGWTRSTADALPSASAASKSAGRVQFVVPASTSLAPARATISGIRTPPPISTSSPREITMDPRRRASPTASISAAALLVTASAASAPVSATRCSSAAANRGPRLPVSLGPARGSRRPRRPRSPPAAPPSAMAPVRDSCRGHFRRVDDDRRDRQSRIAEVVQAGDDRVGELVLRQGIRAGREPARSSSTTRRTMAVIAAGSDASISPRTIASSRSTLGGCGRSGVRARTRVPGRSGVLARAAGPRCRTRASGWARRTSRHPPRLRSARRPPALRAAPRPHRAAGTSCRAPPPTRGDRRRC